MLVNCVTCKANCERAGQHHVRTDCISYVLKDYPKPVTNADRIRATTDEELAKHLNCQWKECKNLNDDCDKCLLNWLKQEVDDG